MATQKGYVKKTALTAYSRPMRGGIIAIRLEEGDRLIDVVKVRPGDDVVLSSADGMSIRFSETDARAMGRNSRGVKGMSLGEGDYLVGMVVTHPDACLFTACEHGYGKRTPFGAADVEDEEDVENGEETPAVGDDHEPDADEAAVIRTNMRYRRQRRGGKGLRDIKTTQRNGRVIGILSVDDNDEILMVSSSGKIQRIRAADVSQIGRNTQGVRIMTLGEDDLLTSIARIPGEIVG
jgi:DNA gyrase subunit A